MSGPRCTTAIIYMLEAIMDVVNLRIVSIDPLQCLHFAGYGTHAHVAGRQKQTNSEAGSTH